MPKTHDVLQSSELDNSKRDWAAKLIGYLAAAKILFIPQKNEEVPKTKTSRSAWLDNRF